MENTPTKLSASDKKILIVDDEDMVRTLCTRVLRVHGLDYIVASNGEDALDLYRAHQEEICLIVSDVSMPRLGGLELFRKVLESDPHANVILMTGYSADDIIPDELKNLCSVLEKPFTAATLMERVRKCLKYDEHKTQSASG